MRATGSPAALAAKGLVKRFKGVAAVDGIDVTVPRGACVALLGPNGAGKTTTVEMLEGLQTPDAGAVEVCGLPLAKERRAIMERIGVVLQETALYKRYTVRETLQLFASFFQRSLAVEEVLARLSLQEKADAQLRTLSGGQRQRVYLGCALINDPELLFLDEPTTGLDPQARRALWDLLAALKAEGRSILLTTHYMEEAEVLADHVLIMDRGRIIAAGTPRQLIREVTGDQILWASFGAPGAALPALADAALKARIGARLPWFEAAQAADEGFEVQAADVAVRAQELFRAVSELGLEVRALRVRSGTLEDVFLHLTGRSMRDD
jgi:ABC-2 type transport system ATP-binding protein